MHLILYLLACHFATKQGQLVDEQCYFITELDSIHIFKASVRNIIRIIGECSFFEYYVLDLGLDKLLCETEHGDLLFL